LGGMPVQLGHDLRIARTLKADHMRHRHAVGRVPDAEIAITGVATQPVGLEILLTQMVDEELVRPTRVCSRLRGTSRLRTRACAAFAHGHFLHAHPGICPCHGRSSDLTAFALPIDFTLKSPRPSNDGRWTPAGGTT